MVRILTVFCAILWISGAASAQGTVGQSNLPSGTICENTYALCTSAPCTPDPTAPLERAICSCIVKSGTNFGIGTTCAGREPVDASGTKKLISTYSFAEAETKDVMTCEGDDYWTDCLDMPCVVDPRDPSKAICTCAIKKGGTFVTYGGSNGDKSCDTNTCARSYWSGATQAAFAQGSVALMATLKLKQEPFTFCPAE